MNYTRDAKHSMAIVSFISPTPAGGGYSIATNREAQTGFSWDSRVG
jgi:hypothetical protein